MRRGYATVAAPEFGGRSRATRPAAPGGAERIAAGRPWRARHPSCRPGSPSRRPGGASGGACTCAGGFDGARHQDTIKFCGPRTHNPNDIDGATKRGPGTATTGAAPGSTTRRGDRPDLAYELRGIDAGRVRGSMADRSIGKVHEVVMP